MTDKADDDLREDIANLHDAFLNASLQYELMLMQPMDQDPVTFMISNRGRLERAWVSYLYVLVEAWRAPGNAAARHWIDSNVSTDRLGSLLRAAKDTGCLETLRETRHYMSHRDKRPYWDSGRYAFFGRFEEVRDLHREFGSVLLTAIRKFGTGEESAV